MKCFQLAALVLCAVIVYSTADYQPAPSAAARPSPYSCIDIFNEKACKGVANGDYPMCSFCQLGYYATCSNGILYIRPCAESYYYGNQLVARMVFDSYTRDCQRYASNCPR
ncbi:unnamed protein product [Lymnaea stagnalis]|uniref:Uncharacterized protein n=1 Tax=Lymnaea stagnalis TaxID=6523 RepID=A0AAV2IEP4_LYMST